MSETTNWIADPKAPKSAPKWKLDEQGRRVIEWVGKNAETKPPTRVILRIFERYAGKCAISGVKLRRRADWRLDHIKPLEDGGGNRESNLQPVSVNAHDVKTRAENKQRAKERRKKAAHLGVKAPPKKPLESRNDLAREKPAKEGKPMGAQIGMTAIERAFLRGKQ